MLAGLLRIVHLLCNLAICVGVLLLAVNIIGIFDYTVILEDNPNIKDRHSRTVSEDQFWIHAYRRGDENIEEYASRLTNLISNRMLLLDPNNARPTFFENWLVWVWSRERGYYEWNDTRRAVRLGGGLCSQHAIVFNNILREQGIESRILGLSGHIVNEVLIEGKWRVYDSDYNITFGVSLRELESNPRVVYLAYLNAGLPENEAKHWENVFGTEVDNWHFPSTKLYNHTHYFMEKLSFLLIWFLPAFLVCLGSFGRRWT